MENSFYMEISHIINIIVSFLTDGGGLSIPFGQVLIFVVINSFCLLFTRYKLGLLITYCFVFYWGFISNREYFIDRVGNTGWGLVYVLAGILMVIIFIISFFQSDRE